ncbi:SRPBCC domain-containing protein [Peribacillus cavernae]|uniref:SRPBCC domain-containing protein n=1 Tax=Peribacillus cavernae TaxID=1674310 RepID=UPI0024827D4E|nr:SRPBCC domain-containing protein [Peribacillus cavernae]
MVYEALTVNIGNWWQYRVGKKEAKMRMEPKLGGLFTEEWNDGGGAVWGTITYIKGNEEIRLNGMLGMKGAVNSAYTFALEEQDGGTLLKLSHHAVGLLTEEWEQSHREGWQELLGKFLKDYVEKDH